MNLLTLSCGMKNLSYLVFLTVTCSLGMVSSASAQERVAKVIRIKGSARYTTGDFVWTPLKAGDVLRQGMSVQTSTDDGSYVDLALGDGTATVVRPVHYQPYIADSMAAPPVAYQRTSEQNVVRVWSDSAMSIDKLTGMQTGEDEVTDTQLDLKRGRITGNMKKLSASSRYQVKLPNGVVSIRGTMFDIEAAGIVKVYVGSMVVVWVDPKTQAIMSQTVIGGQAYEIGNTEISFISPENMDEFEQLEMYLLPNQMVVPAPTMLASDRTVVGMSPVGANPGTIPNPVAPVPPEGGGVFTFQPGP